MAPDSDLDFEEDWADLRAPSPIRLARNDLPGLLEMALSKTQGDLRTHLEKKFDGVVSAITPDALAELVAKGVSLFWNHLTAGAKGVDMVGLIEVILSAQNIPATELKQFVRALPPSLLQRIIQSNLGAQASGIHALLALEVMVREGKENDYLLTTLPSGGVEASVRPRSATNQTLSFRLDDSFSPPVTHPQVDLPRAETANAAKP